MEVICETCMHHCRLESGQRGLCRARKNENGVIVCENYGVVTSLALDPIEKKPFHCFYPGSMILSAGSFGCNLQCPFCQNHEISMAGREGFPDAVILSPQALAKKALLCREMGNIGVAFTYNEPLVGWEYVLDTARIVKSSGMKNVLVTNGTASLSVLEKLLPFVDAMNIDLKGFREEYYRRLGGDLQTVREFIRRAAQDCHVELTTLIIPGENDDVQDMAEEARWIASVREDIPLHITRFFPRYHMQDRRATEIGSMQKLAETAEQYLEKVFLGNC